MRSYIELVLFGSLKKEMADADDDSIRLELENPTPLLEVLQINKRGYALDSTCHNM